ncbi:TetR family transcriptional regulator C-terminal domain-containing protein [Cupriavidus sp. CV2]|uniref:TetR/AcrR family transcriptional regulator n=2 Tax=Cupriavidus TaxID=106589 RepID=UPI00296B11B9|nr:TetR family transcriptional regulator C-terminal domain-containing protein [Cupriavidus sp. CV2]MDW3682889.1 TetR family transcriptional regulator C-terminal domain-containing protein [Cupriavidus sp. CV2]
MGRPSVRPLIVDAGLRVFLRGGFTASSVQDITDEAGVPKGSFYNHFESKEALGAEIVDLYAEGGERRAALKDRSRPPLERLRAHFTGLTEMYRAANFSKGCLLGNFSAEVSESSPEIRERLAVLFARWTREMEEAISEAQQRGEVPTQTSAADLAAFLLDAYEGAILRSRVEKSSRAFERFETLVFEKILR